MGSGSDDVLTESVAKEGWRGVALSARGGGGAVQCGIVDLSASSPSLLDLTMGRTHGRGGATAPATQPGRGAASIGDGLERETYIYRESGR